MSLPAEDAVCVQGGAELPACKPSDDADPGAHPAGACGRPELGCLRTDLLSDQGVCLTMTPCDHDTDCNDPAESTCAATFLRQLYPNALAQLDTDHLYCLQQGCVADGTACSPGQTCLRNVIPAEAHPPDICVPNCDSQQRCPPNHFCLRKISGPANPAVCIPGLLGFECESDVDCLVGRCTDDGGDALAGGSGVSLHLCTIDCASDGDCMRFDGVQGLFFCNGDHHCATPNAYQGASCDRQIDCTRNPSTVCSRFSPDANQQGTCVQPCAADGTCPAYGGVGHTCIPAVAPAGAKVCVAGLFGRPCGDASACVHGLDCRAGICTAPCQVDADCQSNRWTAGQQATCSGSICLPPGAAADGGAG
jgi:hypothetical protein